MGKRLFDIESVVICGQEVFRAGKLLRAPLCLLARVTNGGWSDRAQIVAHRATTGWWHEAVFRTRQEAVQAFRQLEGHKAAMRLSEYIRRCQQCEYRKRYKRKREQADGV